MPIEFRCQHCQKLLRTPDGSGGKKGKCPDCGAVMDIPAADPLGVREMGMAQYGAPPPFSPAGGVPPWGAVGAAGQERPLSSAPGIERAGFDSYGAPPPTPPAVPAGPTLPGSPPPLSSPPLPSYSGSPPAAGLPPNKPAAYAVPTAPTAWQQPSPAPFSPPAPRYPSPNPYAAPAYDPRFRPHRAGMVLAFGIIAVVCAVLGPFMCCIPAIVGLGFGIPAIVMGNMDLAAMRSGEMHPSGLGQTQTGFILGIVGAALGGLQMIGAVIYFAIVALAG